MKLIDRINKIVNEAIETSGQSTSIIGIPQRNEWNEFIDWISQTYPSGISDNGADPTPQIVTTYRKSVPNTSITPYNIKDFQKSLIDYNEKWKTLQPNYKPQGTTLSSPSPVDNRIGSITSKMKFPEVSFRVNNQMVNFGTDIDSALKAYQQNYKQTPYIDPNMTSQQIFQRNQQLRAQGKPVPTNGDVAMNEMKLEYFWKQ